MVAFRGLFIPECAVNGDTAGEVAADWASAVREALTAAIGAVPAEELLARLLPVTPAGYDELNWPNSAVIDLPIVDAIASSAGARRLETAMMHFTEAGPDEWRFRVYRAGAPVPIADLLPLLDHLVDQSHFVGTLRRNPVIAREQHLLGLFDAN